MKRLTTETPDGNFETMLNFVFSKDGWAHIRHDGSEGTVPLTQWAKAQCILHGCGEFSAETPQEIDEEICDCMMMDFPDCPIGLAYCFAVQASHLRDRLKMYEDICFAEDRTERLPLDVLREIVGRTVPAGPLTVEELQEMSFEPAWVDGARESKLGRSGWAIIYYSKVEKYVTVWWPATEYADIPSLEHYGDTWNAYPCKPEEAVPCPNL